MVQDRQLSILKEKITTRNLLRAGKLAVTFLILIYIFNTFRNEQKGVADIGRVLAGILTGTHLPIFGAMLLLVPVNWSLESLKWQLLASKIVRISFTDALKGTLTGLAVGVAAPAQLGDTIGRIAALKSPDRMQALGAAIVSNGIQFYASVCFGTIAWFNLRHTLGLHAITARLIALLLILILLVGVLVATFRTRIVTWQPKMDLLKKIQTYLSIAGRYSGSELGIAFGLGLCRYFVFVFQFVLALTLFDFPVPVMELISCVALIFLSKTVIPAVNVLGDLGLREFTALVVFSQYQLPAEELIAATFLVWIVNVLGPIITGLVLIWKNKWKYIGQDQ
ncbi:lysylphosphatidylglycerol synthase domain-containing protein [Dyadobacter sandarakinus]|uniref:Flippase-like domain-containing protein n=1 Tax=Dyadobacter sandarakinus TaxID=2747268 RepID=A0ABX7I4F3_9BACT|nr:lysylphosphatidylglycerol synthase domain-containing protein [Dyadobacter sandarakinus]QRR00962.1 flippase-like domain-containing protein [Dyadobacter sandarakinus]